MRIIGGSCKGRRLKAPGRRFALRVRPTSDRAREALFNMIGSETAGATVLDLFAGTGALGLEALSRGAAGALFVEADPEVVGLLRENLELCGFAGPGRVLGRDCGSNLAFLSGLAPVGGFSLVLADPPYGRGLAAATLTHLAHLAQLAQLAGLAAAADGKSVAGGLLAADALIVLETGRDEELPPAVAPLTVCRESRRYGEARFHFYRNQVPGETAGDNHPAPPPSPGRRQEKIDE